MIRASILGIYSSPIDDMPDATLIISAYSSLRADNPIDAGDQLAEYLAQAGYLVLPNGETHTGRLRRDDDGRPIVNLATCGTCGFVWNDALCTSITPTPAGRCPNEYGHADEDDE